MKTGTGSFELETPRDRNSSFEPELVKKRQTVLNESLDNKVLSLYATGMSYETITDHLADMYGLEVSPAKISLITDKLLPVITEWRNRPLEEVYPIDAYAGDLTLRQIRSQPTLRCFFVDAHHIFTRLLHGCYDFVQRDMMLSIA